MKITAFVSGAGTTLAHLLAEQKNNQTQWQITAVISDQKKAAALDVARLYRIEPTVISPRDYTNLEQYDHDMLQILSVQEPDLILLLGYLKHVSLGVVRKYSGRIYNTHPSLLPKYGGKGMYGRHVHEAVIQAGELESGVTIHQVSEQYDEGKVLLQKKLRLENGWSAHELETEIKKLEKATLIEFLNSQR